MIPQGMMQVTLAEFTQVMDNYTAPVSICASHISMEYVDTFLFQLIGWVDCKPTPANYYVLASLMLNKKPDDGVTETSGVIVKQYDIEWD